MKYRVDILGAGVLAISRATLERAVSGTYGRQIWEEEKQIAAPNASPDPPRAPFNNATAEHATMAGLMKDVGASYGCHNSVRTGCRAVTPAKSVGPHLLPRAKTPSLLCVIWLLTHSPRGEGRPREATEVEEWEIDGGMNLRAARRPLARRSACTESERMNENVKIILTSQRERHSNKIRGFEEKNFHLKSTLITHEM